METSDRYFNVFMNAFFSVESIKSFILLLRPLRWACTQDRKCSEARKCSSKTVRPQEGSSKIN